MALDALGEDPCSKLNTTSYPNLWLPPGELDVITIGTGAARQTINIHSSIASGGTPVTFLSQITDKDLGGNVLASTQPNSSFRLIQFLSGAGVTGSTYGSLGSIILRDGTTPESIVDTYFTQKALDYNTTWGSSKITGDHLTEIIGSLQTKKMLLQASDIYNSDNFTGTVPPAVAEQSLLYIYKDQMGKSLTSDQEARKTKLEATNLRFFAAFLAEYCFYRTRYQWLLKKYFTVFNSSYNNFPITVNSLTSGSASGLSKSDYLAVITLQLARLNLKMTDMRRLLSKVNEKYSEITTTIQKTINSSEQYGSNTSLTQTINGLQSSAKESKEYLSDTDFAKGVMEYNQEKNRYASVLLGLYAILNVAALAMIWKLK
jgi:hypothetical protein